MSQDGAVTETVCMACNTLPHSTSNITTLILNLAVFDIYIQRYVEVHLLELLQ